MFDYFLFAGIPILFPQLGHRADIPALSLPTLKVFFAFRTFKYYVFFVLAHLFRLPGNIVFKSIIL